MTEAQTWTAIIGLLALLGTAMSLAFALITRTFTAELNRGLAEVRTEIRAGLAEVRAEIAEVRAEIAEVRAEIADLRAEVRSDIADLRGDMRVIQHRLDARGA